MNPKKYMEDLLYRSQAQEINDFLCIEREDSDSWRKEILWELNIWETQLKWFI